MNYLARAAVRILEWITDKLPSSEGLPSGLTSAITTAAEYARGVSFMFPVETLFAVVTLALVIDNAEQIWHFVNWLVRKIPGIS